MAGVTVRDGKGKFETRTRVVKNAGDGGAAVDRLTRSLELESGLQSGLAARKTGTEVHPAVRGSGGAGRKVQNSTGGSAIASRWAK